jgi:hypothetical protein
MKIETATSIVNGITTLMVALPQIIASIQAMDAPEEDKQALINRIKAAQAGLPVWE